MFMFLKCIGEAMAAKGVRGLMGAVPLVQQIYDVSHDAIDRYRQRQREKQMASDLEELVQAEVEQVRQEAAEIAREVASDQPEEVQLQLEAYLSQVPSVARQSLKRPEDVSGTTVPLTWQLDDPIQLSNVLPQRPPQFRIGDRVPHASEWVLQKMLGSGGFGEVWLGVHSFLDEQRAFKFCLDPEARERLLRHEGEVVKRVMQAGKSVRPDEHGIVPLMGAYLEGEVPWLAYEYVEGGDLTALVRQWRDASPEKRAKNAIKILQKLATIVGELHRLPEPIIHRDLKPANVLLRKTEKKHVLRVTDFGISHVAADSTLRNATISTPSMSLGETYRGSHTPIYASPQQKRGRKADPRDDVHALGVLAYQMILGDLEAERPASRTWKKRLKATHLPEDVLDLLESCWDDEPDERPKDALVIAERLTAPAPPMAIPVPKPKAPPPPPAPKAGDIFTGPLGMKFAHVPKGIFWMSENEENAKRQVTIERDFQIGIYPVTQGEWEAIMGNNPASFSRNGGGKDKVKNISEEDLKRFPVEGVSWEDVQEFLNRLNEKTKDSGWVHRLPTEAEWEYTCRGGAHSKQQCSFDFYLAQPTNDLSSTQANFNGNYPAGNAAKGTYSERPTKVGSYEPNSLGVCDMHGNVWEWCQDWYIEGSSRVIRGGGWDSNGRDCRAADRFRGRPSSGDYSLGFRLARSSVEKQE